MFKNQDTTPYIVVALVSGLLIFGIVLIGIGNPFGTTQEISVRSLARQVQGGQVSSLVVQGTEVEARLVDGTRVRTSIAEYDSLSDALDDFGVTAGELGEVGVSRGAETGRDRLENFIFRAFPFFLPAALVMVVAIIIALSVQYRNRILQ